MGYLIGGRIIVPGTEENFKQARGVRKVPEIKPTSGRIGSIIKTGTDVTRNAPLYNDPRYTSSTLAIPTDERTLHGLYRFFSETDPIVGSAIKINSELPLANLNLGTCEDSGVQLHYEEMWERINGLKLLNDISYEYNEIGNVTIFGAWNQADYMWDQFTVLNPDYVKIESTWVNKIPLVKLIPDEALKRIVQTRSPKFIYDQLPPEIIKYVLFNQEIPLDQNNVFVLSYAKRPYETKGKSPIKRILKLLMLEDRFNQANFALATRHAVPITVVKVGDPNTGYLPNDNEINEVRDLFSALELDPSFSIFYHWGINVEFYGSNGKMLPIGPELDRIYKLKFIGLNIHEQLLTGMGGTYAQAYVNLEIQRQRYLNLQLKFENLVHNGFFKPVADMCGFYKLKQATAGYGGVKSTRYGSVAERRESFLNNFKTLRDIKDNIEFQEFVARKTSEEYILSRNQLREYIYPKLDWGAMSAADDENLKNYIKWLVKERPFLVDDATLARLARLDRDEQEKAYIEDLKRKQKRLITLSKEGLLPLAKSNEGRGEEPIDFGGIGDIDVASPKSENLPPTEPNMPVGSEGPPEAATGQEPPQGLSSLLNNIEKGIRKESTKDDMVSIQENEVLKKLVGR